MAYGFYKTLRRMNRVANRQDIKAFRALDRGDVKQYHYMQSRLVEYQARRYIVNTLRIPNV